MIGIPIRIIADTLGAGGVVATTLGSIKQRLSRPRSRHIQVTVSTSEGQNVVLDADEIREKSPGELQVLLASLILKANDRPTRKELAETVLTQLSPDELPSFARMWDTFLAHPTAPGRRRERDDILGSGLGDPTVWSPLVVTFIGCLQAGVAEATKDSVAKTLKTAWRRAVHRRRLVGQVTPHMPEFTSNMLGIVRRAALEAARLDQKTERDAQRFADIVVGELVASGCVTNDSPLPAPNPDADGGGAALAGGTADGRANEDDDEDRPRG
jgi:hypothetical protein